MPGLSIFPTPECFALYKGVVQTLASFPKFSKHLQLLNLLCSKLIFSPKQTYLQSSTGCSHQGKGCTSLCASNTGGGSLSSTPAGLKKSSLFPEQFVQPKEKAPFETCQAFQENLNQAKKSLWRHGRKAWELEQPRTAINTLRQPWLWSHLPLL